jgi:hypothetical protein
MRQSWIVAALVALLGAPPAAQAQSALDKLKAAEKDSKKEKTPEQIAAEKAAKEKAAKEAAEKAAKEKAAKEAAAKAAADKAAADKAAADKAAADKAKADKEKADKEKADKAAADKAKADKAKKDEAKADEKAEDDKEVPPGLIEMRSTRDDRRKASIEKLKARWGELATNGVGKDELERHARFLANLERIRALAEEKKKVKLIEKIDELVTKEELRHSKNMNKLREGAPAAAAAASGGTP